METFGFNEGNVYLWTGQNPSSAIAFVQEFNATFQKAYINQQGVNGTYYDVLTGQRVDITFTVQFTPDLSLWKLFASPTAVHMKADHTHAGGSAGMILYSGRFDSFGVQGGEGDIFSNPVAYHANIWSAYGT